MSRGPGRLERIIRAAFDGAKPGESLCTEMLVDRCYPELGGDWQAIERKHRSAVLRAAHKVIAADPAWTFEKDSERIEFYGPPTTTMEFFRADSPPASVIRNREHIAEMRRLDARGPIAVSLLVEAAAEDKRLRLNPTAEEATLRQETEAWLKSCPQRHVAEKPTLSRVADRLRELAATNDPDVVRQGLLDMAAELDALQAARPTKEQVKAMVAAYCDAYESRDASAGGDS